MNALIIHPGGKPPEIKSFDSGDTLSALQEAVGGHIEAIPVPQKLIDHFGRMTAWINDEGKFTKPINVEATKMFSEVLFWGDFVCGTVVVTGDDGQGETTEVPEEFAKVIMDRAKQFSFPGGQPLDIEGIGISITEIDPDA